MRAINLPFLAFRSSFWCWALLTYVGAVCLTTSSANANGLLSQACLSRPFVIETMQVASFGQQRSRLQPKSKEKAEVQETDPALKRDPTALPPEYRVPPLPMPELEIVKELPVPEKKDSKDPDYPKWREHLRQIGRYQSMLIKGSFSDPKADKDLLRYGITYRLARMTHRNVLFPSDEDRKKVDEADKRTPDVPDTITSLREDLLLDLRKTGTAPNGSFEIRDAFIEILCEEAPKLLDNNLYVRFSVVEILCSINNRDENKERNILEEPAYRVIKPLVAVLDDPKQPVAVKLHPPIALAKICRHKNCKTDDRFLIIETLVKQMGLAKTLHEGYGVRLVEGLATLGDPNDRTRQPVAVEAVAKVLKDQEYALRVRVFAAFFLGRMQLDAYKKIDDIAVEIIGLVEKLAQDYDKAPNNPIWKSYFVTLYFAFQPKDEAEKSEKKGLILQVESKPTLAGSKSVVTEAYQLTLPIVRRVIGVKDPTEIPEQLRKIKTWLDAHRKGVGNPVAKDM